MLSLVMEGESSESESSLPFQLTSNFAVYAADVSDLRQWGIVAKYCDKGYEDCVKIPS